MLRRAARRFTRRAARGRGGQCAACGADAAVTRACAVMAVRFPGVQMVTPPSSKIVRVGGGSFEGSKTRARQRRRILSSSVSVVGAAWMVPLVVGGDGFLRFRLLEHDCGGRRS